MHIHVSSVLMTEVTGEMVKVVGWYDNEAGYSSRLCGQPVIITVIYPLYGCDLKTRCLRTSNRRVDFNVPWMLNSK